MRIGTAYKAKILCSGVFVAGRDAAAVEAEDLAADDLAPVRWLRARVNPADRSVTASLCGLARRTARWRPGVGCALVLGADERPAAGSPSPPPLPLRDAPWPDGEAASAPSSGVDRRALARALDEAFAEPDPARLRRTRAVVVVHRGRLVAERYAPGFSADTPLAGWSLAKGVTTALVGIVVGQGRLSTADRDLLPEWRAPGDQRREISLDHLLRMTSGLACRDEPAGPFQDVSLMLLGTGDAAGFALKKPLEASPGERWRYASGNTNILCRVLRRALGETWSLTFPHEALFRPLGMRSAVLEADAAGDWVGSSFAYATRDWARLGLLFLEDGVWNGRRLLPEGWVAYCAAPTPPSGGRYGAHWWLRASERDDGRRLPPDAFYGRGHEGQLLAVLPSRDLVVVRLGVTRRDDAWDSEAFLAAVLGAVPPGGRGRKQPPGQRPRSAP